ncbi:hypothetical protein [Halomarina rubra]|uniref:Uncharacterized protein n=1 Tax=Halomarina rubra TaxID=2071873 RepID=A0ABD6B1C7_9EURY|nr:hypothetical protein [Halomarina rubra]
MSRQTLTALSQRDEAFWVGLGCLLLGSALASGATPDAVTGVQRLGSVLAAFGTLVIVVRIAVAVFRLFRTTAAAGRLGYAEGLAADGREADDESPDGTSDESTTLVE